MVGNGWLDFFEGSDKKRDIEYEDGCIFNRVLIDRLIELDK